VALDLLPVGHQLRLAENHARRQGCAVAWVLIDTQAGRTLAEAHIIRPAVQVTLAWPGRYQADRYRKTLNLPPNWKAWPTTEAVLDNGAREETAKGHPAAWAYKRDNRPPRTRLDYISPYTGQIRRAWWGQPAPDFSNEKCQAPPAEWTLDRAAHHLGQWMQRGAPIP
jgi:hypothetical protein